jgi:hypothetical protein
MRLDEIHEHLEELLWSFRQPFAPDIRDDMTAEEYKQCETESQVAWDTLSAAFGDKQEFDADWLKDFSNGAFEDRLHCLRTWAGQMNWPSGSEGGKWQAAADSMEECYELTDRFMQDHLWPFTRIMRYDTIAEYIC